MLHRNDNHLKFIIFIPMLVTVILFVGMCVIESTNVILKSPPPSLEEEAVVDNFFRDLRNSCIKCPANVVEDDCSNSSLPVLGGVDVVNYFTLLNSSLSTAGLSKVGAKGVESFQSIHTGYKFQFVSLENKNLFDQSPMSFVPQFGGFCAMAILGEHCPNFGWTASCLGPTGNLTSFLIANHKLYFFRDDEAKETFLNHVTDNIRNAENRWNNWFPNTNDSTKSVSRSLVGDKITGYGVAFGDIHTDIYSTVIGNVADSGSGGKGGGKNSLRGKKGTVKESGKIVEAKSKIVFNTKCYVK